jgi:sulfur relay protein TusB/DsrH
LLIILRKSLWAENYGAVLEIAKRAAANGEKVAVLYVQDACIATMMDEHCEKLAENRVDAYALKADCEARGLVGKVSEKVKLIDYRQWVELMITGHDKIVSWTS